MELVNEMVEQALVDNLLENDYYPHTELNMLNDQNEVSSYNNNNNNNNNNVSSVDNNGLIGVSSGNGQASSNMVSSEILRNRLSEENDVSSTITEPNYAQLNLCENSTNSNSNTTTKLTTATTTTTPLLDNDLISILIRFVNEKEMRVQVKPNDTILFLKK